ncbi:TetR/AcrR family transcriptional regulator [Solitalea canadensis]|uniref:Transcriptional regulator n=1 Tax=Solitalea canadensis (strain ATCC 29591 / DSM 3403 / JCM 21819 / LMG 8368 / NBRC 15130 / NCIMB 12057 / USAM 9D) TaxID=929556 RepID=H8KPN1_SOLCM|nr:TetR/AcrR family transcriptional regulator [Solitalea canadensis]AFD05929.1 transcriptional regulator [Solitalea canadensis DSM 3403]
MSQVDIQDDKQELIVEAALKRFAHYGPSKTTMNEIADDLHLSKALLYYYFPDKASLFKAVVDRILNNYFEEIECEANHAKSIEKTLLTLIDVRHDFFMKYYNMGLNRNIIDCTEGSLDEIIYNAIKRETIFMKKLLTKANDKGEMQIENPLEAAELYMDVMAGVRFSILTPNTRSAILDEDTAKVINRKQKQITELFIRAYRSIN